MEERKSQCDSESEVFANLEELKKSFQTLANFFGFTTQIQASNERDIITMNQEQDNKYIFYRRSEDNVVNVIKIGIHSDDPYGEDMYFAIDYDKSCCRLRLHKPTYEMYSKNLQYNSLVGCESYTIRRDSCIHVNMKNSFYYSQVYGGGVSLIDGNYIEHRPVVGKFSLPEDIAKHYKNYGYKLCGKPGELGGFYVKDLMFTPEESQQFIRNILRSSKYLPSLIADVFQKLGCTETCDASEIFRLIVSLLPQEFVTDFFGSEEIYHNFLKRLEPENIRRALDQLRNRKDSGISASNNPELNYSAVQARNLGLLNGIPNLRYEIIDDERHGHGIKLSINNTESRQDAKSQYSILFSDNVIDIKCEDKKILVDLNSNNPQIEIDGTQRIVQLDMYCNNSGPEILYDINTSERFLGAIDIANPIEYIEKKILNATDFKSALKETVEAFLSSDNTNISLTKEQLLGILYASAPRMAAIIKDSDIQPLGGAKIISPIGHK